MKSLKVKTLPAHLTENIEMDLSDLTSGAYLVRVSSGSTFKTVKIIKE